MKMRRFEKRFVNSPRHSDRVARQAETRVGGLDPRPGGRLLDVGCGNGAAAIHLTRAFVLDVVGVDVDPDQIAAAQAAAAGLDGARFLAANAAQLPFADGEFDLVYTNKTTHHIPDWPQALAQMARVLKPGGHLVYSDFVAPRRTPRPTATAWTTQPPPRTASRASDTAARSSTTPPSSVCREPLPPLEGGRELRVLCGPGRCSVPALLPQRARSGLRGCRRGPNGPPNRDIGPRRPLTPQDKAERANSLTAVPARTRSQDPVRLKMAACSILSIQCADVRASAAFYDAVLAVAVLTERGVQGDRLAAVLLHLDDLLRGYVQLGRELPRGGLAAQVLEHLPPRPGLAC